MSSTFTNSAKPAAHVADALSSFAQLSLSLAALPLNTQIAPEDLQHALMSELKQRDLATRTNRLRLSQICSGYLDAISPLTTVPELMQLYGSGQHIGSTLGKLLRPPRSGTHPLRYLGLIYWLFGSWPRFMEKLSDHDYAEGQSTALVQQAAPEDANNLRQHFLACMKHGGSVTHCAKSVGIDVSTGLVWAARAGMPINRRAKSISSRTYEDIARDLRAGHVKTTIAARHHVSAATVNRVLASVSGLHDEWRAATFASMQAKARSVWSKALDSNAGVGVTALRKLHPSTFAWLHRNDRTWLTQSCELVTRSNSPAAHRRIDWAVRDMALEASVAEAVALIRTTSPDPLRQVRLWEIYQLVPELKAKLGALKKLPKTREAILRATKYAAGTPKS